MSEKSFPACLVRLTKKAEGRRAAFYLAAEEFIARELPEDSYLMSWQLLPTVVMGRNQVAHQEIDIDYCRENSIDIIRRKSGGGAIFADEGNIMWSLVTRGGKVEPIFMEYAESVSQALRELGAPAKVKGRNDVVIEYDEKSLKVCGNAFYHLPERNIVHGTMLFDTDYTSMQYALHPDESKLKSAGVRSVRARTGLLKDVLDFGVDELRSRLEILLTDRMVTLDEDAIKRIEEIETGYYTEDFLYASQAKADEIRKGRIDGCGMFEIRFFLKGSVIRSVELKGDFFEPDDNAEGVFNNALRGKMFTPDNIESSLRETNAVSSIRGLNIEDFMKLI